MKKYSNRFGRRRTVRHLGFRCVGPTMTVQKLRGLRAWVSRAGLEDTRRILGVVSGKTRFRVLSLLGRAGTLCVCDLADILEMETSAVSQQLKTLRRARLVTTERLGTVVLYRLANPSIGRRIGNQGRIYQ